jgi:hypothetical protein
MPEDGRFGLLLRVSDQTEGKPRATGWSGDIAGVSLKGRGVLLVANVTGTDESSCLRLGLAGRHPAPAASFDRAAQARPAPTALDSYERVRSYERQTESATPGLCSAPVLAEVAALVSHPRSPEHPHRKTAAITPSSAPPAIETASVSWLVGRYARPLSRDVGQRIDLAPGQPERASLGFGGF